MRSLSVVAFSGVLLALTARAPLHAQANAPTKSEEVSKMQTETERLTAEKALIQAETDKIKAETDQWKAKYALDFGTIGKSGAVDASGYKSLPWNKLVLGFPNDADALLKLVTIEDHQDVLLSDKPIPELVVKWRFFEKFYQDLLKEINKPIKVDPSMFTSPGEGQRMMFVDAGVVSAAVVSLDSLLKLFRTERTVTSTEFTGLDEAFLHVVMGALLKTKPGGMTRRVYLNGFILPVVTSQDIPTYLAKIKQVTDRREELSKDLAAEVAKKEARQLKAKEQARNSVPSSHLNQAALEQAAKEDAIQAETIRQLTERIKLVNDFIALYSLNTQKGIEDLIVGEKLSTIPTLCLKVVKAFGDTLLLKKTFVNDQLYVSRSFTVQYAQLDASGQLIHAGLYSSQEDASFVRSPLKTSDK